MVRVRYITLSFIKIIIILYLNLKLRFYLDALSDIKPQHFTGNKVDGLEPNVVQSMWLTRQQMELVICLQPLSVKAVRVLVL